ncbi:MAG: acetyl-CoA carboxylase biotin carboxylase subunit [Euryarchaeota archaeon]|nr:acetyl-CoA carboxylase biotin carboxylase subunit [Euryarchaeota archaeon]
MFRKILVANRGEIAVRVIRAARSLGVKTVAVYSDADRDALFVRMADEAVRLGPAPAAESYLRQDLIVDVCLQTGADAVHPGYGFLSENAAFARRLASAGITFIGPSPEAMERLGDKVSARKAAVEAGVPVSPGSEGALPDATEAARVAAGVGYPVMLKAAAGGGGIGMRVVADEAGMADAFEGARSTAEAAFGVPDVFLEKFIERPRHIEVQVIGDHHGNVVHLGERECSIQRRHQKLVEEAPSPALTDQERQDIGAKAVALAKAGGYTNAGTLEFLYEDGAFYFNEMNTRLQVEHPVTEMVTGIDLAAWQIRVAAGEPLGFTQDDIELRGHAIELRINAEDPAKDLLPSPGRVAAWSPPAGPGVRVDHGLVQGWTVPAVYDSMVAKVIAHGADRDEAVRRLEDALSEMRLVGFPTNVPVHKAILADEAFRAGDLTTRFLEERNILEQVAGSGVDRSEARRVAAIVAALDHPALGGLRILHHRQTSVVETRGVVEMRPVTRDPRPHEAQVVKR